MTHPSSFQRSISQLLPLLLLAACGGSSTVIVSEPNESQAASDTAQDTSAAAQPQTGSLEAAIHSPHRSQKNRARDVFRHPAETLAFFGLSPDMTVVELSPGRGWYTEILSPALSPKGHLIAAVPPRYREIFDAFVATQPLYQEIEVVALDPEQGLKFAEPGTVDMVLTFRNTHGWVNDGHEEAVYKAAFAALKPGGVFGVVQHRANADAKPEESAKEGYVPEAHVIEVAKKAGFVFEESSEVNTNASDTKDYPEGVWTLPPVLRLEDKDRAKYEAIGESDRMTLRFRKPGAQNAADDVVL